MLDGEYGLGGLDGPSPPILNLCMVLPFKMCLSALEKTLSGYLTYKLTVLIVLGIIAFLYGLFGGNVD